MDMETEMDSNELSVSDNDVSTDSEYEPPPGQPRADASDSDNNMNMDDVETDMHAYAAMSSDESSYVPPASDGTSSDESSDSDFAMKQVPQNNNNNNNNNNHNMASDVKVKVPYAATAATSSHTHHTLSAEQLQGITLESPWKKLVEVKLDQLKVQDAFLAARFAAHRAHMHIWSVYILAEDVQAVFNNDTRPIIATEGKYVACLETEWNNSLMVLHNAANTPPEEILINGCACKVADAIYVGELTDENIHSLLLSALNETLPEDLMLFQQLVRDHNRDAATACLTISHQGSTWLIPTKNRRRFKRASTTTRICLAVFLALIRYSVVCSHTIATSQPYRYRIVSGLVCAANDRKAQRVIFRRDNIGKKHLFLKEDFDKKTPIPRNFMIRCVYEPYKTFNNTGVILQPNTKPLTRVPLPQAFRDHLLYAGVYETFEKRYHQRKRMKISQLKGQALQIERRLRAQLRKDLDKLFHVWAEATVLQGNTIISQMQRKGPVKFVFCEMWQ
jgi:hypothetical protein